MTAGEQAQFTTELFTHNIETTFFAFAGGITAGILTGLTLLYNGVLVGVIGGLMTAAGNGTGFVDLITAHGVLEISCTIVAATAGLRVGAAIIDPGYRPRAQALQEEAKRAVLLAVGTAPWLVVAASSKGTARTSPRPGSAR